MRADNREILAETLTPTYTRWAMHMARAAATLLSVITLLAATIALPLELTVVSSPVKAASTTTNLQNQLKQLQQQEAAKEAEAKRQETLKAQADAKIKQLDSQISQLQNNIQQTNSEINNTNSEIGDKNQQVAALESELRRIKDQQDVLLRQMYMMRSSMPDSMQIFSNQPVSDREKEEQQYTTLRESVTALYLKTTAAKQDIELARSDLVSKSERLALLREQQDEQKQGLASYQSTQAQLKTNAEATLKKLDAELLKIRQQEAAAQAALNAAIAAALANSAKGIYGSGPGVGTRVARGTAIGIQGSTGFSTGDHVHLEARVNNVPVNPQPYINNGTISWPLRSFTITQPFGKTSFSYVYQNGIHTGIDIAGPRGSVVYAPADGTVILNSCPNGCGSGYGHAWAMQLDNGMVVLMGHLR